MPAALLIFVGQAYFLAARDPVTPLLVAVFAGCFNLGGDLLLCNVFNLGIAGASAATSFAQVRCSATPPSFLTCSGGWGKRNAREGW